MTHLEQLRLAWMHAIWQAQHDLADILLAEIERLERQKPEPPCR